MSKILKNLKARLFFILCMLTITFSSLLHINHNDLLKTFRGIYGGISLNSLPAKMGFIFFVILLQFTNADTIIYYLNNASHLSIRYGCKEKMMRIFFRKIMTLNFIFVSLSGVAVIISAVLNGLNLYDMNYIEILEILLRGYLTCLTISTVQILLMIIINEAKTFMILLILSIALIFLSQINKSFFTILPVYLNGIELLLNISICIFLIIFCAIYTKATFYKQDLY